jgi:hypothetical protein
MRVTLLLVFLVTVSASGSSFDDSFPEGIDDSSERQLETILNSDDVNEIPPNSESTQNNFSVPALEEEERPTISSAGNLPFDNDQP